MKKLVHYSLFVCLTLVPALLMGQENSLLWKISGNGLEQDSYIFGTIHLLCQDDLEITETMKTALSNSNKLVLELDYDDPTMPMEIQKWAMLEDGKKISDFVSEEDYATLSEFFQSNLGMPMDNLAVMKPFLLMSLVIPTALQCPPGSYELSLTQLAGSQEKEVLGLETVAEQMGAIDSFTQEELASMLVEAIENFEETKQEYADLVVVYKKNDPNALYDLMQEAEDEMSIDNFNEIMLDNRNKEWIDRIEAQAQAEPTFFAVGAGHLGGENGVLALLKAEGYTLTPLH